ncbi:DUF6712 family protein [Dysgonomonas massiliensis]|uniref:DUF6712 family protein n=1 Tax=Dysgonomonas massiliensis TaxID=2040292 RepID=UPI000C76B776|nr:DUF6712 family protein [Dysgonomonas massiliensis]
MNNYQQTPLISEALFKQHSPVTSTTDITDFVPYIGIAQELYIEPILGSELTDELKEQIAADNLSVVNSNLIARIAPALSFYAVYQALPFHWATIVNKGITVRESENSRSVDVKDIAQLRRWIKDDADILRQQLSDFLHAHATDYPLWTVPEACADKATKFDSGFHFPKH